MLLSLVIIAAVFIWVVIFSIVNIDVFNKIFPNGIK